MLSILQKCFLCSFKQELFQCGHQHIAKKAATFSSLRGVTSIKNKDKSRMCEDAKIQAYILDFLREKVKKGKWLLDKGPRLQIKNMRGTLCAPHNIEIRIK